MDTELLDKITRLNHGEEVLVKGEELSVLMDGSLFSRFDVRIGNQFGWFYVKVAA